MKRTAFEIRYRTPAGDVSFKTVYAVTSDLATADFKRKNPEARFLGVALQLRGDLTRSTEHTPEETP